LPGATIFTKEKKESIIKREDVNDKEERKWKK